MTEYHKINSMTTDLIARHEDDKGRTCKKK